MSISEQRVFRSELNKVACIVAAAFYFLMGAACLIASPSLPGKLFYGFLFFVTGAIGYRYAAAKLATDSSGVSVENLFSSYQLDWDEIDRFELGRWKINGAVCLVHLASSEIRPAIGVTETNWATGSAARMVDELNDELSSRTHRPLKGAQAEHFAHSRASTR